MDYQGEMRKIRKEKHLTIKALSERSGVPYTTLQRWEAARGPAPIDGMAKVLEALGYELVIVRKES